MISLFLRIYQGFSLNTVHPPICQFFISRKSVDESGFVDKLGFDKSEDALY